MPKLSETTEFGNDTETTLLKAVAFDGLKKQEKEIKKELKVRGDELRSALNTIGVKDPNNDNVYISGTHLGKAVDIVHSSRKRTSFIPEVEEVLKDNLNEEDFNDIVETVTVIREDLLEQKILEGKITSELLDRITEIKETFALSVKVK